MPVESAIDPDIQPALLRPLIAPKRTALLVIDVQQDFCSPSGAAANWGADLSNIEATITRIQTLIVAARTASVPVVFVRLMSSPETDSLALKTFNTAKGRPPEALALCRTGTLGADYYRIAPEPADIEICKTLYSSFAGTDLEARLRNIGVDTLVLSGVTTECCVDSTARDAFHHNFNVLIVKDACAAYEASLHHGTLATLSKNYALLTRTEAVRGAWDANLLR